MKTTESRFLWRCMAASLILHLVTAYFSVGYHSADEQFQILEFLSYKLGKAPVSVLAVEYGERMRPWLQPALYYAITRALQGLGIQSPFTWALSFRLFAGFLGWLSTLGLALASQHWFAGPAHTKTRKWVILALMLIWYFPALHVRPSSESLGGSAFFIGVSLITILLAKHPERSPIGNSLLWAGVGACFGLSFESRFQMGIMIAGALAWLGWNRTLDWRRWSCLAVGFLVLFGVGRWVDHWGYGDWSFSPWNYYSYNLVRGEVSRYGRAPWWDVFRMAFTETWPFLGLFLAFVTILAWIRHPKHLLTWSTVPFFLVHELIAHKELRFFFPIAAAGPVFLVMGLTSFQSFSFPPLLKRLWSGIWSFLCVNNGIALVALLFLPFARTVQFYEGVYRVTHGEKLVLHTLGRDPYEVLGTPIFFYRPEGLEVKRLSQASDLTQLLKDQKKSIWLFSPRFELEAEVSLALPTCELKFRTLPAWVKHVNWGNWLNRVNAWGIYRCTNTIEDQV